VLKAGALGAVGAAIAPRVRAQPAELHQHGATTVNHGGSMTVGEVDLSVFDPTIYLTEFDYGKAEKLPDGRTQRTYQVTAVDKEIEVAPGVKFAAWAYNGRVPGPTLRATEGDLLKIHFVNAGSHPHTMHFHGIHPAGMDGVFEPVAPGGQFTYEFDARPFGLHLYHCHTVPLRSHIHKGLYGTFIVDPPAPRPQALELVMMANAFDVNFDMENEIYAVNTVAFHYMRHPIRIKVGELVRVYFVNITEFDPINGIHIHANFFNHYRTGTRLEPDAYTDTITMGQAERSILEFSYDSPGRYMFHAHVTEFTELGWNGVFEVVE
jgi:FtsP/CotA-like multicopper oxidase with cupredoxin domain